MSNTGYALAGFVSWALLLLVVMETIRTHLVVTGKVAANAFTPDNSGLSPFMQRLARAHANCIEGLPIFGGLLAIAIMVSRTDVTDPLAFWFLGARIVQSIIHLASNSPIAVSLRFTAFAVQMAIGIYWSWKLMV
ncbi:MAPEG family protein [Bradyrhizobium zhanjiangense]|uniref:MAPEG family protein n=1 Tax=Bradyrhizobium zhanjiangense TaxID=1325107 RepID=A0A4Q0QI64_9BRAD|nr:MAPEG family protein [Bradyrhizobium zhanjiangense]RXG92756.1 MAPEG family protein [Bradyrhizobium zhanjiangense]